MNKLYLIIILMLLFNTQLSYADTKIVKWVDKQGVTHYGDRPPSFEESKTNVEMNKQGMVTKKNAVILPKDTAQDLQQLQQKRKDKILLDSYTNANEIDLARDRSLEMSKAALTSLASQKESLQNRIGRNNQLTDHFKKRNKPLPANLDKEFNDAVAQSGRIDKQVADHKLAMAQMRKNYAEDKARYLMLKQPAGAPEAGAPATPTQETIGNEKVSAEKSTAKEVVTEKSTAEKVKSDKK